MAWRYVPGNWIFFVSFFIRISSQPQQLTTMIHISFTVYIEYVLYYYNVLFVGIICFKDNCFQWLSQLDCKDSTNK